MHHNNINPNALDLCEEEKKMKENGDSVKAEGVCTDPFVNLARPTPWVSSWVISFQCRFSTVRVIKSLMG
jgi:hypothetical protein